ncbi:hypothetical protein [Candidatus Poriferisodalis sp.]
MELKIAIEEWLARFSRFELATEIGRGGIEWGGAQVRGPRSLHIRVGL